MVNVRRVFDLQGVNWWIMVSGIGMDFMLTAFVFMGLTVLGEGGMADWVYTLLLIGAAFGIPLLVGYVCGRLADERYLTYALYPLVGFLILAVPGVLSGGIFGLLTLGFGILGAFNGANLAARSAMRRRRRIYGPEEDRDREVSR